jgi:RNA polymerase sigma factor (sigma-70 family)
MDNDMTSDAELLSRYAHARSEPAFAELVRRHVDFVHGVARRRLGGDTHLAQDIAQRVFTELARQAGALSHRPVLVGWLHTTTRFLSAQLVRTERRRRSREERAELMPEPIPSAPVIDAEHLRPLLDELLDSLGERDREAVLMRFFEGKSFAEMGLKLSLTENTARMRVDRAVDKLRERLKRRGVASTVGTLSLLLADQAAVAAPAELAATITSSVLSGATAVGGAAAVLSSLALIMTTTKTIAVSLSIVALLLLGLAVATYQVRAAHQETAQLQQRLHDTESRLLQAEKRTRAADDDKARLLAEIASSRTAAASSSVAAPVAPQPEKITQKSVQERFNRAQDLDGKGRFAEALADYLWCYDIGMVKEKSFSGVRVSFLIMRLLELGGKYPPALAALKERRDQSEQRMLAGSGDRKIAADFATLNDALGDSDRTLAAFDRLSPTDPQRQGLATHLESVLLEAQRYTELAQTKPYGQMTMEFETLQQASTRASLGMEAKSTMKDMAINKAVQNIELLAGAGDLEHARELALKLLDFDSSAATQALMLAHMTRAGQPSLLTPAAK